MTDETAQSRRNDNAREPRPADALPPGAAEQAHIADVVVPQAKPPAAGHRHAGQAQAFEKIRGSGELVSCGLVQLRSG